MSFERKHVPLDSHGKRERLIGSSETAVPDYSDNMMVYRTLEIEMFLQNFLVFLTSLIAATYSGCTAHDWGITKEITVKQTMSTNFEKVLKCLCVVFSEKIYFSPISSY